jgi:hypothetical protein
VREVRIALLGLPRLGEPEIEHLDPAFRRQHHVGGLEVAMDNALLVGGLQPLGDLERDLERLVDRHQASLQPLAQGFTDRQLHDQKALAVVLLEAVEGGDVLVAERCQHPGLAFEAGQAFGILRHLLEQHLDRDLAIELGVPRPIHLSHSSGTEDAENLVAPKMVTGRESHS